jgi:hypothetical protein
MAALRTRRIYRSPEVVVFRLMYTGIRRLSPQQRPILRNTSLHAKSLPRTQGTRKNTGDLVIASDTPQRTHIRNLDSSFLHHPSYSCIQHFEPSMLQPGIVDLWNRILSFHHGMVGV